MINIYLRAAIVWEMGVTMSVGEIKMYLNHSTIMYHDIYRVVDKYFSFMQERDSLHYIAELIPADMKDYSRPSKYPGTQRWKVISSAIMDDEILEYEQYIGYNLPLSYKCFVEMSIGENDIIFFRNLSEGWMESLIEEMEPYSVYIKDRGMIPFAHLSDHGVVCFDANHVNRSDNEYRIVELSANDGFDHVWPVAETFSELILNTESYIDTFIRNK